MKPQKALRKKSAVTMDWGHLLNWKRYEKVGPEKVDPIRSPFKTDYERIVFSSAFRRLQDKTQVFPLSSSDFIRKRLTHSIEVSSIARSLGISAGYSILKRYGDTKISVKKKGKITNESLRNVLTHHDFGAIVATAALAHDLGNPPFGHSGEDAVRHWFQSSRVVSPVKKYLSESQVKDIELWEGNAQGLRILTRLQMTRNNGGMRLTNATLGAFTKYPCVSTKCGSGNVHKKFGFFMAEASIFQKIAQECGLLELEPDVWCRHPLAYLMEAADDIAYRIIDLEDGFRLGRITYAEFAKPIKLLIPASWIKRERLKLEFDDQARVSYLRALAISSLIKQVSKVFNRKLHLIMTGKYPGELIEDIPAAIKKGPLDSISNLTCKRIYTTARVLETEAAGYEVIGGLLDIFWQAIEDKYASNKRRNGVKNDDVYKYKAKKVLQLLPDGALASRETPFPDRYQQLLHVIDYVTGMTDTFALTLYRKLKGIALPS